MLEHLKRHAIKADLRFFIPWVLVLVLGCLAIFRDLYVRDRAVDQDVVLSPFGLLLLAVGGAVVLVAFLTLRRNYSSTIVIHEGHQLVTHGIYRFLRHPIYLGTMLVMMAIPLTCKSWLGVLVMALQAPLFHYRMGIEERLLEEEFGEDYRAYTARTYRLVPGIY